MTLPPEYRPPDSLPISVMLADLYAAIDEGRPWSLVRLGDGELRILRQDHAPITHVENRVDSDGDLAELRTQSVQAIHEADWVGWHQDQWLKECMENIGAVPRVYERAQYAWVNLHMGIRRSFVERVLRRERLFLVGEPMQRWLDEVLRPARLGAEAQVYQGTTSIGRIGEAMEIGNALRDSPARVVLASMGVWALPLCGYAKRVGKIGIDWGHAPDQNLMPACEAHKDGWGEPAIQHPVGGTVCPEWPACKAHWRYRLNTEEEDSPAGTNRWYAKAGAPLALPEVGG